MADEGLFPARKVAVPEETLAAMVSALWPRGGKAAAGDDPGFKVHIPWLCRPRRLASREATTFELFEAVAPTREALLRLLGGEFLVCPTAEAALEAGGFGWDDLGGAVPDRRNAQGRGLLSGWDWHECLDELGAVGAELAHPDDEPED